MIFTLALIVTPALFGTALVVAYNLVQEKTASCIVGSIAGITTYTSLIYALTLIIPLTSTLLLITIAAMGVGAIVVWHSNGWSMWKTLPHDRTATAIFLASLALFLIIAPKLLVVTPDGLSTGIINAYGDLSWHAANVTMFAEGQSFPPENPIFSNTPLVYPFLSNFFSAMLIVAGASLPLSITLPAILLIPIALTLIYLVTKRISKNKVAAVIAVLLFLFGGATLGWTRMPEDIRASDMSIPQFFLHLPQQDYSGVGTDEDGFHFLNPVTSLLLPQRPFLFGIPIALAILFLLTSTKHKTRKRTFVLAGVLSGMLPLFHAHATLALVPAIIGLFILSPSVTWIYFLAPALVIGIPEVAYYATYIRNSESFFRLAPGWMAGEMNIVWYWIQNTGLLLPAALYGICTTRTPRPMRALAIAGLTLFIAANTFLFAPWEWDNFKLFVFWLIFSLPIAAYLAAIHMKKTSIITSAIIIVLLGVHMFSAALDIWKISLPTARVWPIWNPESVAFARVARNATLPGEDIITAPTHNSPITLAGRPRYLGYTAHVWSHGGDPFPREQYLERLYTGRVTLNEPHPSYILIGPQERARYAPIHIHPAWELVAEYESYELYRLITPDANE